MADQKITALTNLATPAGADLFVVVDDVAGTATTKKATITAVEAILDHDALVNYAAGEHFTEASISHANITAGNGSDHANVATNTTHTTGNGADHADVASNTTHRGDNTQAHTDYLINNGNDTTSGILTWSGGTSTQANTAYTHSQDNTQAHTDYLLNSGTDIAVGPLTITADNSTVDQAYVPMVLYNTDGTPPAASGFPVGTIYIQYTA